MTVVKVKDLEEKRKRGGVRMNPIIRSAERAAYILDVSPQAFREQAKRGLNNYSKVVKGKNKKTYEFYPYIAA